MSLINLLTWLVALLLTPFFFGVTNRTKAFFAGRTGKPLFQLYYDLAKLFKKGTVYSKTTTLIFRWAPIISLAAVLTAAQLIPYGGRAPLAFPGDILVFVYLLGLARFLMNAAALDTGSSFEGMGASREAYFSVFAELTLLLSLAGLAKHTSALSLSDIYGGLSPSSWQSAGPILALMAGALFIVFLAENARVPIDDPNTHLELTMLHEVIILDYCGVDLAYVIGTACVKFLTLGTLVLICVLPFRTGVVMLDGIIFLGGMMGLAVIVGIVESAMARLRLLKVPQLLMTASCLAVLAIILQMR